MTRTLALVLTVAFCAAAAAAPLRAQAGSDTTGLAQAVASAIADSVIPFHRPDTGLLWRHSGTPLDSAVAGIIGRTTRVGAPVADSTFAVWIGIARASLDADTASVVVERTQQYARTGSLTGWTEWKTYVFRRSGAGWRLVRTGFVRHADWGPVRGR